MQSVLKSSSSPRPPLPHSFGCVARKICDHGEIWLGRPDERLHESVHGRDTWVKRTPVAPIVGVAARQNRPSLPIMTALVSPDLGFRVLFVVVSS